MPNIYKTGTDWPLTWTQPFAPFAAGKFRFQFYKTMSSYFITCSTVPLVDMTNHLTGVHSVAPASTGHALLLWILANNNQKGGKKQAAAANQVPSLPATPNLQVPPTLAAAGGLPSLPNLPNLPNLPMLLQSMLPPNLKVPPATPSFLQSILNGEAAPATSKAPPSLPILTSMPTMDTPPTPPQLASIPMNNNANKLEHVVAKLTRKHTGVNARESYQCQVCSKWFAVPPIKHLRGHLVTFRDEQRPYIQLVNNNGYACLTCFHIAATPQEITEHVTNHVMTSGVSTNGTNGLAGASTNSIADSPTNNVGVSPPRGTEIVNTVEATPTKTYNG